MKHNSTILTLGFSVLIGFSVVSSAQQKSDATKDKATAARGKMNGGMMMGQMMTRHQEMSQLMGKMTQSMTAINNEKDPTKLKSLLAEHAALIDQMRAKMSGEGTMMQNMAGQVGNCPMVGDTGKAASK